MKECRLVAKVAAEAKKLKKKTFFEKDVDRMASAGVYWRSRLKREAESLEAKGAKLFPENETVQIHDTICYYVSQMFSGTQCRENIGWL